MGMSGEMGISNQETLEHEENVHTLKKQWVRHPARRTPRPSRLRKKQKSEPSGAKARLIAKHLRRG
jgi:hypothetical protein